MRQDFFTYQPGNHPCVQGEAKARDSTGPSAPEPSLRAGRGQAQQRQRSGMKGTIPACREKLMRQDFFTYQPKNHPCVQGEAWPISSRPKNASEPSLRAGRSPRVLGKSETPERTIPACREKPAMRSACPGYPGNHPCVQGES